MASKLLILERETGLEPATSSLGNHSSIDYVELTRFSLHSFLLLKSTPFPYFHCVSGANVVPSYRDNNDAL